MTIYITEADAARLGIGTRRTAKHAREARPDIPRAGRAAAGEGDRVPDLMRLAAMGWVRTNYDHRTGEHWMTSRDGKDSPRVSSYRAMLDTMLKGETR